MPAVQFPADWRSRNRSHHYRYTIRVEEALTREHAISIASERFNELYDDGELHSVVRLSGLGVAEVATLGEYDVTFLITGNYIGPYGPPDRPDEDAHRRENV